MEDGNAFEESVEFQFYIDQLFFVRNHPREFEHELESVYGFIRPPLERIGFGDTVKRAVPFNCRKHPRVFMQPLVSGGSRTVNLASPMRAHPNGATDPNSGLFAGQWFNPDIMGFQQPMIARFDIDPQRVVGYASDVPEPDQT